MLTVQYFFLSVSEDLIFAHQYILIDLKKQIKENHGM